MGDTLSGDTQEDGLAMIMDLTDATRSDSGGKAAVLGTLIRAGLPVPDGFVVPGHAGRADSDGTGDTAARRALRDAVALKLARFGDPVVAVRSSAQDEDSAHASAAGQYETVLGVRGADDVCRAVAQCRASARSARVDRYRARTAGAGAAVTRSAGVDIAVLVQPMIEADASGVMFTPARLDEPTRIEASWGLGPSVVGGTTTPDAYAVGPDGGIDCSVGGKASRVDLDRVHGGVITTTVASRQRNERSLNDDAVRDLAALGHRISWELGAPQDIEWAIIGRTVWILQARPITAAPPFATVSEPTEHAGMLRGAPGSSGTVTARVRIVHGPTEFESVTPGDIVVCPYTTPAWSPLLSLAAGVITEVGGTLSHAAIVAREYGIAAVLGVTDATARIEDGACVRVDGSTGTIAILGPSCASEQKYPHHS